MCVFRHEISRLQAKPLDSGVLQPIALKSQLPVDCVPTLDAPTPGAPDWFARIEVALILCEPWACGAGSGAMVTRTPQNHAAPSLIRASSRCFSKAFI